MLRLELGGESLLRLELGVSLLLRLLQISRLPDSQLRLQLGYSLLGLELGRNQLGLLDIAHLADSHLGLQLGESGLRYSELGLELSHSHLRLLGQPELPEALLRLLQVCLLAESLLGLRSESLLRLLNVSPRADSLLGLEVSLLADAHLGLLAEALLAVSLQGLLAEALLAVSLQGLLAEALLAEFLLGLLAEAMLAVSLLGLLAEAMLTEALLVLLPVFLLPHSLLVLLTEALLMLTSHDRFSSHGNKKTGIRPANGSESKARFGLPFASSAPPFLQGVFPRSERHLPVDQGYRGPKPWGLQGSRSPHRRGRLGKITAPCNFFRSAGKAPNAWPGSGRRGPGNNFPPKLCCRRQSHSEIVPRTHRHPRLDGEVSAAGNMASLKLIGSRFGLGKLKSAPAESEGRRSETGRRASGGGADVYPFERGNGLSKLLEFSIDAIVTIDRDQRIVDFNPAACRMFRCRAEEAMGSDIERFVPERYRASHREGLRRFATGEGRAPDHSTGKIATFQGLRADGEEFPLEASITRVEVDERCLITIFIRDMTDRVRAEEALRRSKDDLELAVRGAEIGIWNWDSRSAVIELSERCRQLFGIPAGQSLTYVHFLAAIHPDDRRQAETALRRALVTGCEYKIDMRYIWPDGSIHWVASIGRHLYDQRSGKTVGMRGIALDITERKCREEELRSLTEELEKRVEERTAELLRANAALERSNLELQQFAFVAAHDLQTPLRSISGFAQLLHKDYHGRFDAQADSWLDQLVVSAHRMRDLIQDILTYSRVESRGSPFRPLDFKQIFHEVVSALADSIGESGAVVTRDELPVVLGDRTQLVQVLQNLIDNAIKYHRVQPPRVHVSARGEGEHWVFSVRDNGIGIADKYLDQIFDIFRRLHSQQEYPGTGIGLAICRRVVHRHGGRIWVESAPGRGSVFHFTLPRSPAAG